MFGSSKKKAAAQAAKAERQTMAADYARQAKQHATEAAKYHKSLKDGSTDPAADRYMIRQHEANARICELNARDLRK